MSVIITKTKSFLFEYKLFVLFFVLNVLDIITTVHLINLGGIEGNIVPALALKYGVFGLVFLKAVGIVIIVSIIHFSKYNKSLIAYPSMIMGMAVLWNILVIL